SRREEAAERRSGIEELEERRADRADDELAALDPAADRELSGRKDGGLGERMGPARQIDVARVLEDELGAGLALLGARQIDAIDGRRVAQKGRGPEHHPIDDAEHRGIGADSETERDHHRAGEPWPRSKGADRVTSVLDQHLDERHAARRAALLLVALDAP